ncbi:response regulator transcription factor [Actinomadura sp. WMMB 499]|uniref:response regulator transcription factor n=1 Tax=Actinomadura sp. WMMB 499 TaxID=1219491 RepID=UPI001248BDE9|nr:response regulator transcription factor [Actinomadura sp. WMMB 499]QFG20363.1 response regulator transcription factor [Actinomadura sp. WMMB 499]
MRLLIIEDEKRLARPLAQGLAAEGFAVDTAHDGVTGLNRALENDYDLILLDIMLPGMNGYRVCSALRAAGTDTPILMLTAKDGEYDHAEGLDTGADDYLTKPFSYVVLLAHIRALLRRRTRGPAPLIELGDLTIDPAARRVLRGDVQVELTAKEFALLEHLATHAGLVVSKAQILEHVWDGAFEGDPNIVEVYVSSLRRKLDAPFGRRSITTVRGAGYRLAANGGAARSGGSG